MTNFKLGILEYKKMRYYYNNLMQHILQVSVIHKYFLLVSEVDRESIISISQVKKWKLTKIKWLAQGHISHRVDKL